MYGYVCLSASELLVMQSEFMRNLTMRYHLTEPTLWDKPAPCRRPLSLLSPPSPLPSHMPFQDAGVSRDAIEAEALL